MTAGGTIFALSSGNPPAAIAVVRVSGPQAGEVLRQLSGKMPEPRVATLATLREPVSGEVLDRALALWFPGPASATGEDLAELHLHGGRSVVAAVLAALAAMEGLRPAEPGEFTRRAFENGRIDLSEAEGLADLLTAETEGQRRAAIRLAGGALSRRVEDWQRRILHLAGQLEARLDFSDEGDVGEEMPASWRAELDAVLGELERALAQPEAERLKDGIRVVIAGPPNAGKSSLFNYLVGRDAAITSEIAGTTRDLVEAPMALGGIPFLLVDTAGLRESGDDIESIGVDRARQSMQAADLVLWLGAPEDRPGPETIVVQSKADLGAHLDPLADIAVSAVTGEGVTELLALLATRARGLLPADSEVALNRRHRDILAVCVENLAQVHDQRDLLVVSETFRSARVALDRISGRAGVENMLDSLFGTFCIGK